MNVLLICRPAPGVDPGSEFPPHLPAERDVLHALREQGALTAAYSPGGPGAVLMLDVPDLDSARRIGDGLPLAVAGLIEIEIIPLKPLGM
jgi:hypothetical protein